MLRLVGVVAGIFGIADEIHENLQNFVFFDNDGEVVLEIAVELDMVPEEGAFIEAQSILDKFGEFNRLGKAGDFRVFLLHGDDIFDVGDILPQGGEFFKCLSLPLSEMFGEAGEIGRYLPTFVRS